MDKKTFYNTLVISISIQIITGIMDVVAYFVPTIYLLRQLLILELFVQILEGTFYVWLAYHFNNVSNVTPKRYMDWVITTPTMLITFILFLIYLKEHKHTLEFFTLMKENSTVIIPVLLLNWLMLLFGYLGEIKKIPVLTSVLLGFIPFLIYYYIIYVNYVQGAGYLFWYFFFFWGLYGIAALLPYYLKNMFYNILDLFAKNFFGIFLSYIIISGNY